MLIIDKLSARLLIFIKIQTHIDPDKQNSIKKNALFTLLNIKKMQSNKNLNEILNPISAIYITYFCFNIPGIKII